MKHYILGIAIIGSLLAQLYTYAESKEDIFLLEDYLVSAGPGLRSIQDYAAPVEVISEKEIATKNATHLAGLLEGSAGVSASSFTAGASRPVLRGFSGSRVQILESGLETFDVSALSPDHAVTVEPMLIERVEILRGPATLLYGGSAIGGAINVVDKSLVRSPLSGFDGAVETRYENVSSGITTVGHASFGMEDWAFRVTGLDRENENYKVPDHEKPKLDGSYQESSNYSFGATRFFGDSHYFGISLSEMESEYGVPGHEHDDGAGSADEQAGVFIKMENTSLNAEYSIPDPFSWAEALRLRAGYTDYLHDEIEDSSLGIRYEQTSWDLRGEIAHKSFMSIDTGVIGFQMNDRDFVAAGDEAFTPNSNTQSCALFVNEHWHGEALHYEIGARLENANIQADGVAEDYSETAVSLAASAIWNIDSAQTLKLSLNRSQRNPSSTELYSEGAHLATQQYFVLPTASLKKETALSVDLTYEIQREEDSAQITAFYARFDDYIFGEPLGYQTDDEGRTATDPDFEDDHALDTYRYRAVDVDYYGLETCYKRSLLRQGDGELNLKLTGDWVKATQRATGESLPRIPPVRLGLHFYYDSPDWMAGTAITRALSQTETASNERETSGYTQLNAYLSKSFELPGGQVLSLFTHANNLLDRKIVHHTSYSKEETPLPGRNISIGLRMDF
ncbi:MAG: putative TonB-dependent receptor [Opitutia bacterium UBA7350]|nr:MAG: putative TonB-dependent receptor [Opitutae bacterium UBA7350]